MNERSNQNLDLNKGTRSKIFFVPIYEVQKVVFFANVCTFQSEINGLCALLRSVEHGLSDAELNGE
jgi:hypothetical protein